MTDSLQLLLDSCKSVKSERDIGSILRSITSEVGELSEEVDIELGTSYKSPSDDGVIGEAVDVILGCIDIIAEQNPDLTAEDICNIANKKMQKWKDAVAAKQKIPDEYNYSLISLSPYARKR